MWRGCWRLGTGGGRLLPGVGRSLRGRGRLLPERGRSLASGLRLPVANALVGTDTKDSARRILQRQAAPQRTSPLHGPPRHARHRRPPPGGPPVRPLRRSPPHTATYPATATGHVERILTPPPPQAATQVTAIARLLAGAEPLCDRSHPPSRSGRPPRPPSGTPTDINHPPSIYRRSPPGSCRPRSAPRQQQPPRSWQQPPPPQKP